MYKKKGYALILALVFTTIALSVGASIALSVSTGSKLSRQDRYTTEAYLMARSGMHDAINMLRVNTKEKVSIPFDIGPNESIQSLNTCSPTDGYYMFTKDGKKYLTAQDNNKYTLKINEIPGDLGETFYAYQICANGVAAPADYIRAVGFAYGRKVALHAEITHKDTVMFTYTYDIWDFQYLPPLFLPEKFKTDNFASSQCIAEPPGTSKGTVDPCGPGENRANIPAAGETEPHWADSDQLHSIAGGFNTYFHNEDYVKIYQVGQ